MKLSLKGFFIHEALGDEGSSSSRGKGKPKPPPPPPTPANEHQDPTANVDAGSSIWSDPEQPVDVKKFSSRGGNLHIDLCEMFSLDEMGGPGSGRGRPKGSKNKTQDEIDAAMAAKAAKPPGKRGRPLGWRKPGTVTPPPAAAPAPEELPDEMPAGFDDPTGVDTDLDSAQGALAGGEDGKLPAATPEDDEEMGDLGDIDWGDREDWINDPDLGAGVDVPVQGDQPPKPPKPRIAGPDYTGPVKYSPEMQKWIDDNPTPEPEPPKDGGQFWRDVNTDELETMEWEELRATEPEIASDLEREYPDLIEPGFFMDDPDIGVPRSRDIIFAKNKDGDLIMYQGGIGARYKWDKDKKELIPMDDGGTPAGEF